jgi:hypothetical protein
MTLEPLFLIAKTVTDDLPYPSILTTKQTVLTPLLAHFLVVQANQFSFWQNFPGGAYKDPALAAYAKIDYGNELKWINRTDLHSGILSTPGFQVIHNGPRARGNIVLEALTCNYLLPVPGVQPDPNDNNIDLTKRTYCQGCHVTLEPLAKFFNRWPPTQNEPNYLYNPAADVDDAGSFLGKSGNGAIGLGQIVSTSDRFKTCAIRRALEFVYGRTMGDQELTMSLTSLSPVYEKSNQLKPVIKQILMSPVFLTAKSGG